MPYAIHVGLAGWAIRKEQRDLFGEAGSHLQRYAARFATVEINSSFYRPHQHDTYVRWSDSVPGGFRFSVKMPRWLTHDRCLADTGDDLRQFLREVSGLGPKLGCILVQLPPGLPYDRRTVETFCSALRSRHRGPIAWEPRHPTWFTGAADRRLEAHGMARVAADPICGEGGGDPGGSERVTYFRLQGSPVMYHLELRRCVPRRAGEATVGGECACARVVHLRQHGAGRSRHRRRASYVPTRRASARRRSCRRRWCRRRALTRSDPREWS